VTPAAVKDWRLSKHHDRKVGCSACHGEEHGSAADAAEARMPSPDTCGSCHAERVAQFKKGKHAMGWASMRSMPTVHRSPPR
jgi:hypothetical protein